MSFLINCNNFLGNCPSCPDGGENGVTINQPQFGESTSSFKFGVKKKTAYGGLMNTKNFRTNASSFTILKKALTTIDPSSNNMPANVGTFSISEGPNNTGGPGDEIKSVPIVTTPWTSGWKRRLISLPIHTGVDVKHNSYERYLTRKRGWAMRCQQNCS